MRLAISNIAWDVSEDEQVAQLLNKYDIDAIDIAPGKYFADPLNATEQDISKVKSWWATHGIEITGMQALLFGTTGLNVFGDLNIQQKLLTHLNAICRIGAGLGATRLVFGSPKNRDRSGLNDEQTVAIAIPFFKQLGDIAQKHGVVVCLEPNPTCYGANFMTTSAETAQTVSLVNHAAIKMQIDTGAVAINNEYIEHILNSHATLVGHIHASEPELMPLGDHDTDHKRNYRAIAQHLPDHIVTIEMLATKNEPHLNAIKRALCQAIESYRPTLGFVA